MNDEYYMQKAYHEALKALKIDEVPVGAVIVRDGKIIARGHNQRESKNMATAHAETIAIQKACRKLNSWRLDDCTLYTTLEPCLMCTGVIIQSRIQRVVYGAHDTRWLAFDKIIHSQYPVNHIPMVTKDILIDQCSKIIKDYFKQKR
ncbi:MULTISPECIES: nucleoside deaminase [Coprobacillaceae]|uniref:nucleoside deaminase n=1 Tax=Coprobacillaceae TaxID=2810280 RepID=UPI000E4AEED7|nr:MULTISPECIES: nucleoside deaminase [Coprobacillaceae]RHM60459.1 nucleoside deaminase [Coprobacillus sp. AF33-1AC]RHS95840.1 nucleoside deaminase [Erysipelatoclostridium sp. AM42-17]